jgi:hypothetical protein
VPRHESIEGNEMNNQLTKLEAECPFKEPGPARGISAGIAKKVFRDWTN